MKSLVSFWAELATELARLCGTDASRDIVTLSRRAEHEGDSFLRITLPDFGKAFDQALEEGRFSDDLATGFRRQGGLPQFLGGFLRNVFALDGYLLDDACTESIRAVRQLCAVFGKIEGVCTPVREKAAISAYIKADEMCHEWDLAAPLPLLEELAEVARLVTTRWLSWSDREIGRDNLMPRHGPGQTADRLVGNKKYDLSYWPDHLEARFSWADWAIPNYRFATTEWGEASWGGSISTHVVPARLTLVPKTMSSPRVIVMEPTSLQYMQQGLLTHLVTSIERSTTMIGFSDQSLNRKMARQGSMDRSLATVDLSEASDRVTYLQAATVFSHLPNLWEALDATRSAEVKLVDGSIRQVHKFASMGSAVCFPVEAVVFLCGVLLAVRTHHRKTDAGFQLSHSFLKSLEGKVRVYGDDIVVPVEYLPDVRDQFARLGWVVNEKKSFAKSYFRESCGGDYWRGEDVTPVRVRNPFPRTIRQVAETQSLVSLRNQMYLAGYWRTASILDNRINKLFRGLFPIVKESSPALGRVSVSFEPLWLGTDSYQRALTRAYRTRSVIPKNGCTGVGALLKCLIAPGKDDEHLQRSGRPSDVSIIRRWIPVA